MSKFATRLKRKSAPPADQLLNRVLKLLAVRPRSEAEIRRYLLGKTANREVIEGVVGKLAELNYLNDAAFARWWVEQRGRYRPQGRRALCQELRQKGVDSAVINQAVERLGGSELALARRAAAKKLSAYKNLDGRGRKQKLGQFLARRGFAWETIRAVVDTLADKG